MAWNSRKNSEPEKKVETYLADTIHNLGGLCWKFTSPGTKGVPDRIVMLNDMLCFVELKRPKGGRITDIQKWRIKQLVKNGQKGYVLCNTEMVDELVDSLMKGKYPEVQVDVIGL